ncbi:MAG: spore protein [Bacteroidetes bacterium]|nr:MAG: spore protein [Bacteroidota bacterium]
MGVTRLERKGRKNKTVAKVRVATIKRLKSKITIESPNKEESGVVIGDVLDVLSSMNSKPAKAKKEVAPKAEEKKAVAVASGEEE